MERHYVYMGGRWEELNRAGCVRGRRVSFLYVKAGSLLPLPRDFVLRELQRRAAGRRSVLEAGPTLPSVKRHRRKFKRHREPSSCKPSKDEPTTNLDDKENAVRDVPPALPKSPPVPVTRPSPLPQPRVILQPLPDAHVLAQKQFAANLGLRPAPKPATAPKPAVAPKPAAVATPANRREYLPGEDLAIARWLLEDERRSRGVRGVLVWQQLERLWPEMAGICRSWHSLKNRYVRYILPALSRLPLSETERRALRDAARRRAHSAHASILDRTCHMSASARLPPRGPLASSSPRRSAASESRPRRSPRFPAAPPPAVGSVHPPGRRRLYNVHALPSSFS